MEMGIKEHGKSYSFDLTWINLDHSDPRGNQFLPETFSETANGRLACAVYTSTCIRLSASDRSNVNHVTTPTTGMEYWEYLLGHLIRVSIYWFFLDLKDGQFTLISPVTLVDIMMLMSSSAISPTLSTPFTSPLGMTTISYVLIILFYFGKGAHALLTRTSMSLQSSGSLFINPFTSLGEETSSLTGRTFVCPPLSALIDCASSFKVSSRRAANMSLISGEVRENSIAIERPIPEDAPVIKMVFPPRRAAIAV